jgi:hypothetical protein
LTVGVLGFLQVPFLSVPEAHHHHNNALASPMSYFIVPVHSKADIDKNLKNHQDLLQYIYYKLYVILYEKINFMCQCTI